MQIYPPGPEGHDWWLSYTQNPLNTLIEANRQYGDLVHFHLGTKRHLYLVCQPDYIRYILIDHPEKFHRGLLFKRRMKRLLGNGLLTSEGEFNKRQRRLVQPGFHHSRIACYAEVMTEETQKMMDGWQAGQSLDIHQEMAQLTMTVLSQTLFGIDVRDSADKVSKAILESFEYFNSEHLPEPVDAIDAADKVITRIINERRALGVDTGDLLSMLLLAADDVDGQMTDKQIRDEVMVLLLAGHETSANALSWAWYLLAQHPEVEAKLHAELDSVLGTRCPTMYDLSQLPYVDMIIKEALRLYSPAWNQTREVIEDVQFGEYTIPKGSTLIVSSYITHRSPHYFDEPEQFRPERFADGYDKSAYFPFSMGPRVCIGQAFATMEMQLVLATVAQRYRLMLAPGHTVEAEPFISLRPKGGLPMTLLAL